MGVVAGFWAGMGIMDGPYLKRALFVSLRRYLQIGSYIGPMAKLATTSEPHNVDEVSNRAKFRITGDDNGLSPLRRGDHKRISV